MSRILFNASIAVLLIAPVAPVLAQQLQQTPPARPIVQNAPAQAVKPAGVATQPGQRPGASGPIRSTGPSTLPAPAPAISPGMPVSPMPVPVRPVLDERGRPVPGAQQLSPTRAYDPATGRYYDTRPR